MVRSACLGVALAAALIGAAAQPSGEPAIQVGDQWTFAILTPDGRNVVRTETVTSGQGDRFVVEIVGARGRGNVQRDRLNNTVVPQTSTPVRLVQWPLEVGMKWEDDFDWTRPDGAKGRNRLTRHVVARERVATAAGEFDAYRIEATGTFTDYSNTSQLGAGGRINETYWYAPGVRHVVKYTADNTMTFTGATRSVWSTSYELTRYSLK